MTAPRRHPAMACLDACSVFDPCLVCLGLGRGRGRDVSPESRERLRQTAARIRGAFDRASEGGDLGEVWGTLADTFREGRETLLAWFQFLEEVVQLAEARYGTESGRGAFKAQQVKAAVRHLVAKSKSPLKGILLTLGPGSVDVFLDVMITTVVAVLNQRKALWGPTAATPGKPTRPRLRLRILAVLARFVSKLYSWLENKEPLDPTLMDEVAEIAEEEGDPLGLFERFFEAGVWINENRRTVEALMEIVALATDEAEFFTTLRGHEKQAYARELILVTLEQEFGIVFRGAMAIVAEAVIDFVIDFLVGLNDKHGLYPTDPEPLVRSG
jgi:hypothetical protein